MLRLTALLLIATLAAPAQASDEDALRERMLRDLGAEASAARRRALTVLERSEDLTAKEVGAALDRADLRSRPLLLQLAARRGMHALLPRITEGVLSEDPSTSEAALRALVLLGADAVAAGHEALAKRGNGRATVQTAQRLRALDVQRTVEAGVLAKWRRKGGSYRGRYANLVDHGWSLQPILLAMLLDVPLEDRFLILPETDDPKRARMQKLQALWGIATSDRRGYQTFQPLPLHITEHDLFELAQQALRDVADIEMLGDILESVATDLNAADEAAGFRLRRIERLYAESIEVVLYAHGRRTLLERRLRTQKSLVTRARRNMLGGRGTSSLHWFSMQAQDLAALYHLMEEYDLAASFYLEAIEASTKLGGNPPPIASYNRACALACGGHKDDAIKWLDTALKQGVGDLTREWVAEDGDLRSLHGDPRYDAILKKYFGK